jgi:hypothetical protein
VRFSLSLSLALTLRFFVYVVSCSYDDSCAYALDFDAIKVVLSYIYVILNIY